jgi:hypothetical protein
MTPIETKFNVAGTEIIICIVKQRKWGYGFMSNTTAARQSTTVLNKIIT